MPKLCIDGCNGSVSITAGCSTTEHTSPYSKIDDVFFHTDFAYVQLVDTVCSCVTLCCIPRSYYTWESSGSKTGGCYITAACVEVMGLEDDCDELQTLRSFRDELLSGPFETAEKVAQYYDGAPKIVAKLDQRPDKNAFYTHVYYEFIVPAVKAVKDGDTSRALEIYSAGVNHCANAAEEAGNAESRNC
jgi:hypothetical protein